MARRKKLTPAERREAQIKRNEDIQRVASVNISNAQMRKSLAQPIKPKGDDSLQHGDADLEVQNDNGYGTHTEYPGYKCKEKDCQAAFHAPEKLNLHTSFYHAPPNMLFG